MRHTHLFVTAAASLSLLLPSTVFAATPQQILNESLAKANAWTAVRTQARIEVNTERLTLRNVREWAVRVVLELVQRTTGAGANADREGRLRLVQVSGNAPALPPFLTESPFEVNFIRSANAVYLRLTATADAVAQLEENVGFDLTPLLNTWVSFDVPDFLDMAGESTDLLPTSLESVDPELLATLGRLDKLPPLQVLRVEKRTKDAEGRTTLRLRVRVNPTYINTIYNAERRKLTNAADRRDLDKKMVEVRKALSRLSLVAVVRENDRLLQRMELGYATREAYQTCPWNERLKKTVCKNAGYDHTRIAAGMNIAEDAGAPVTAPTDAIPLETLLERLFASKELETRDAANGL